MTHTPDEGRNPKCRSVRANSRPRAAFWRDVLCAKSEQQMGSSVALYLAHVR